MTHLYRRQPPRGAKVAGSSPLGRGITAHFLFNGDLQSSVRGKSGKPTVVGGVALKNGPRGSYVQATAGGQLITNLYAQDIGFAGSAPRSAIAEYDIPDTNAFSLIFSVGDKSRRGHSQFTLCSPAGDYRRVVVATYDDDLAFQAFDTPGSGGRMFVGITYDGNVTLKVRSWVYVYSTGQTIFKTFSRTLTAPLQTGTTEPLTLLGGGLYDTGSLLAPLYHLSLYGGRCLTPAEIDRLYADRHQVMAPLPQFPYVALAARAAADTALAGAATAVASASGSLTTSIQLAGSGTATAAAAGTLGTAVRLVGAAQAQASAAGALSAAIRLAGSAPAAATATGALATSIPLAGTASAVATATGALAGGGTGLSGTAVATASGSGMLTTAIPLAGAAYAQTSAAAALATQISLSGLALASAMAAGVLSKLTAPGGTIDVSKISPARIVVFEGTGSRVVPFEGSGSRVVVFEGSGSRVVPFESSGSKTVRFE